MFDNNKKLQPCQKTPNKLCFLVVAVVDLNVLLTVLKNFFLLSHNSTRGLRTLSVLSVVIIILLVLPSAYHHHHLPGNSCTCLSENRS